MRLSHNTYGIVISVDIWAVVENSGMVYCISISGRREQDSGRGE